MLRRLPPYRSSVRRCPRSPGWEPLGHTRVTGTPLQTAPMPGRPGVSPATGLSTPERTRVREKSGDVPEGRRGTSCTCTRRRAAPPHGDRCAAPTESLAVIDIRERHQVLSAAAGRVDQLWPLELDARPVRARPRSRPDRARSSASRPRCSGSVQNRREMNCQFFGADGLLRFGHQQVGRSLGQRLARPFSPCRPRRHWAGSVRQPVPSVASFARQRPGRCLRRVPEKVFVPARCHVVELGDPVQRGPASRVHRER